MNQAIARLEKAMKSVVSVSTRCPSHCNYWTYSSTASFFCLENSNQAIDHMYSKIHVYYGELGYRHHGQKKENKVYLAFCEFGNVVGLYSGMSIISFFMCFII